MAQLIWLSVNSRCNHCLVIFNYSCYFLSVYLIMSTQEVYSAQCYINSGAVWQIPTGVLADANSVLFSSGIWCKVRWRLGHRSGAPVHCFNGGEVILRWGTPPLIKWRECNISSAWIQIARGSILMVRSETNRYLTAVVADGWCTASWL